MDSSQHSYPFLDAPRSMNFVVCVVLHALSYYHIWPCCMRLHSAMSFWDSHTCRQVDGNNRQPFPSLASMGEGRLVEYPAQIIPSASQLFLLFLWSRAPLREVHLSSWSWVSAIRVAVQIIPSSFGPPVSGCAAGAIGRVGTDGLEPGEMWPRFSIIS